MTNPASNQSEYLDPSTWSISVKQVPGSNILGLIFISIVIGLFISLANRTSNRPLLKILSNDLIELVLQIANYILLVTPIGVVFLIMPKIIAVENMSELFKTTGLFAVTVLLGLAIHALLILPAIYYIVTKKNPYKLIVRMSEALLTSFGTSSSVVSLPATLKCLEQNEKVDPNLARLIVPIGAAINMDGTALYEAVAAIFLAQLRSMAGLDLARVLAVSITTTVAVAGATGIPNVSYLKVTLNIQSNIMTLLHSPKQAGITTMAMVLSSLNMSAEDLALVFAIDWLLHRFRTMVNVLGDIYGAAIVAHLSREDLAAFNALEATHILPITNSDSGTPETEKGENFLLANNLDRPYENSTTDQNEKITAISFNRLSSV